MPNTCSTGGPIGDYIVFVGTERTLMEPLDDLMTAADEVPVDVCGTV
jgi:hypothetical protein